MTLQTPTHEIADALNVLLKYAWDSGRYEEPNQFRTVIEVGLRGVQQQAVTTFAEALKAKLEKKATEADGEKTTAGIVSDREGYWFHDGRYIAYEGGIGEIEILLKQWTLTAPEGPSQ